MKSLLIKIIGLFFGFFLILFLSVTFYMYYSDNIDNYISRLVIPDVDKQFVKDLTLGAVEYDQIENRISTVLNDLPDFNKGSSGPTFIGYENILLAELAQHYLNIGDLKNTRAVLSKLVDKDNRSLWAISQLDYLDFLEKGELKISETKSKLFPTVFEFENNILETLLHNNNAGEAAKLYWMNYDKTKTQQVGLYLQRQGKVKHYEWNVSNDKDFGDNVLSLSLKNPVETDVVIIKFPIKKSVYSNFKIKINGKYIKNPQPRYGINNFLSVDNKYLRALSYGAYSRIDGWRYGPYLYYVIEVKQISDLEITFNEIKDVSDLVWLNTSFANEVLSQAPTKKMADLISEYLESNSQYVTRLKGSQLMNFAFPSENNSLTKLEVPVREFGFYQILIVDPEVGKYTIYDEFSNNKLLVSDMSLKVPKLATRPFLSSNNSISVLVSKNVLANEIIILKSQDAPPENLGVHQNTNISFNPTTNKYDMISPNASITFFIKDSGQYFLDTEFYELLRSPRDLIFRISGKEIKVHYAGGGDMKEQIDCGRLAPGYVTLHIESSGIVVPDETLHNGDKREIAVIFKKLKLVKGIAKKSSSIVLEQKPAFFAFVRNNYFSENFDVSQSINISLNSATNKHDMISKNASITFVIKNEGQYFLDTEFYELLRSPRDLIFRISGKEIKVHYAGNGDMKEKIYLGGLVPGEVTVNIESSGVVVPDETLHNGDKREIAVIFKKLQLVKGE